ncbi:putative triacylglycerol lipase [Helianthus annuus]|uniref:Triacylglycerol lipase n=1 Tax=Helianthus annuus TaxID=4232 RepID=A0A251TXV8_HELAN|nr:triacylglycerol lipase OBL1 [Helianthus annuus]KAF5791722.1 putative triacylglycerol lipase [Helianthus annuus]KAJ0526746.1 putative triacylglycerol lipase [Helianthus annuus]KAJ0535271.1 putative triacylglycerol lipase [Helianthus annuus]KAJ0543140.1 putative triacylglycerol lipase [Helianthus annuus]KAJ0708192.1 putative triacylglycerol lipase [Helianthus annuus]
MATELSSTKICDKSFCEDYLLLSPKDVTLWNLIMLLLSKNIGHRSFIDCPAGTTEESFSRRFVIVISIVAQMVLTLLYKPLSWVGSAIEFLPNFMDANGGFLDILLNLLSGKLVLPNKESPEFLTVVGLLDIRRDLDKTIKHEDPRYTSALAVMAAKSAYENAAYIKDTVEKYWKMEFLGFFDCWNDYEEDYTTQGFMWSDKTGDSELIGVSFRGTSPFNAKDWSSDVDLSWYELPGIGKVHAGFLKALGLQKKQGWPKDIQQDKQKPYAYYVIRQKLKERLENNPDAKFLVTGHSLGAALSIVFPAILAHHNETELLSKLEGVYTFGQPRVGDHKFGEFMKDVLVTHGLRYRRFVYCNDLVPRVPFDDSDVYFKHFGDCHYYNSFYEGQVLPEEPNKNYFSMFALIPMFINAVWELLRSFIMYYHNGPEYYETYTCRGCRLIGLLIAGLPAHGPTDYVNLTRLGSPELFMASFVN